MRETYDRTNRRHAPAGSLRELGAAGPGPACVILADSDPRVQAVVDQTLRPWGLDVICSASAQTCLRNGFPAHCRLLIADLGLPGMNGLELLAQVRRRAPWLPVAIMSADADVPTAVKAIKAGAADFLGKPLDQAELLRVVGEALRPSMGPAAPTGGHLTRTENRVLELLMNGLSNKQVAGTLSRSERTVEVHRNRIMHKLGAHNVADLVKRATPPIPIADRTPLPWQTRAGSPDPRLPTPGSRS
jgi:FixJ family two-component response regulator